ncbi:hypothetical protein GUJ93_ZPchr0010g10697 [Zizania palustris]|uniref:Transcription repressor n=1 Tax=Zizania palustris TaxID=103762 RepID=A0A8J5W9V1_ZIZPA|nr:hypothetical protein GUJ93_ZPchr0010g10697 [Zizania palustris]
MGSSHERFRLSHLMPNSWFYKLRDMNSIAKAARNSKRSSSSSSHCYFHGTTTPKPLPLSPRRSYYSYAMQEKQMPREKKHHRSISPDLHQRSHQAAADAAGDGKDNDEFQDLVRLRPIRTRPAASIEWSSASGTCPSSPRLRSRRLHVLGAGSNKAGAGRGRRRRSGIAVVKASAEPATDFRESMVEMVVENGVRAPEDLLDLLEWYLSVNSREHHGVIMEVFRSIWIEIITDADSFEL